MVNVPKSTSFKIKEVYSENMGTLLTIGKILTLIAGIINVVFGLLSIIGTTVQALEDAFNLVPTPAGSAGNLVGAIIAIVCGIILIFAYTGRLDIRDSVVLGIVVIVVAWVGGTLLGIIGGILILLDGVL